MGMEYEYRLCEWVCNVGIYMVVDISLVCLVWGLGQMDLDGS